MPRYLYIFCYQTPEQESADTRREFADESCEAVFIEAESPEKGLEWGRNISEQFFKTLFGPSARWADRNYAHWVESDPEREYPLDVLERLPAVPYGTYPEIKGEAGRNHLGLRAERR